MISRLILKVTCSATDLLCGAQSSSHDEWRRANLIFVLIL